MRGWAFRIVPEGWERLSGGGLRRRDLDATATVSEDALHGPLRDYVESRVEPGVEHQGPFAANMEGAEEALILTVFRDGGAQRTIYARRGAVVGILTMKGPAPANGDFIEIVRGASFGLTR